MNKIFILAIAMVLFAGCKKNRDVNPNLPNPKRELNEYLASMQPVQNPGVIETAQALGDPLVSWAGSTYCKSTKYKLGPEYSEGFLLNPQTDVIYPGAILDGNSIYNGTYKLLSLPRTGGTISTDLVNAQKGFIEIKETKRSTVQQGMLDLMRDNQINGSSAGAQINFQIDEIRSEQQMDMHLGFSLGVENKMKVKAGFDFNQSAKKTRVLARFQQIYYTLSYDPKNRPADYFQPGVTSQQVYNSIDGTPFSPVYVSNVKYGRMAFYCFESTLSSKEIKTELEAQFTYAKVTGSIDASYKSKFTNDNTKITGTIIGGSGSDAVQAINGVEGFYSYILAGGNYSASSPGLPIAYTLRRISDNGVFNVVNISEYVVNECYNTTGALKINFASHINGPQDDNIWGDIKANIGIDSGNGKSSFAHGPVTIFFKPTADDRLYLKNNGEKVNFDENSGKLEISYNPEKFDKTFIDLTFNLTNRYYWFDVGKDKHNGTTDDYINKTVRIYLKDIVDERYGADWSKVGDGTLNYNLYMDGAYKTDRACTKKNAFGGCSSWSDIDVSKTASNTIFNFSINVNAPQ
ncbi:MAG: thiol-activated cytolysin family protein [Sporocytophaga sp.]|nr:thiol-activated cytolysin family protein [Sporocytophaga sp.]